MKSLAAIEARRLAERDELMRSSRGAQLRAEHREGAIDGRHKARDREAMSRAYWERRQKGPGRPLAAPPCENRDMERVND